MKIQLLVASFGLVLASASAQAVEQKPLKFVLCKNQKTVRSIRITPEKSDKASCQVTYSKAGVDEVVGESRSVKDCGTILQNIQANLESSQWDCKSKGSASVSFSNQVSVQ